MEERREIAVIQNPKKDQYSYLQDPGIQKNYQNLLTWLYY